MNTDATQRLAASFDAARVRAMMDTSNARTRLRKRHPYPNAPGWEDRVCGLAQVDESERRTTAALDDAWARATRLLDVGLDPASMVALLASHSEPDLRLHVEAKFPGTLPDAESPHWAMCVAIAAAAVEDPSFRAHLSHRFYYEAAAFDAAFPSAHPQHGANMSDRITVTPSELCAAYDPTVEIPGDQGQVADLRREAEASNYPRVVLVSWARGHEAPSFAACGRWNEPVEVTALA